MDKRNLYAININDAILNSTLNYKKMRVPKKLTINDIKCHPFETYVLIACSDGYVRIILILKNFKKYYIFYIIIKIIIDKNLGSNFLSSFNKYIRKYLS